MLWLYRFCWGFLRVVFYGEFKERILNLAACNRITLWNSSLNKKGIETFITVRDFKKLPKVLKGSGIRVHILKRCGLPFKISKNRKRLGWGLGIIIFLIFLKFMSGYIWIIDIVGNEKVESAEILKACNAIGIKEGIRSDTLNTNIQRQKLLLQMDSLAWASLNIEGCRLTVNVSEIEKNAEDNSCICNLKSKADGIIQKIDVTAGNCIVKKGDTVKKGDILVSGVLEKATGTEFVHSAGTITAVTERSITVEGEYESVKEYGTGEVKVKKVLEVFGLKIPLFLGSENKSYKSSTNVKTASFLGQELPLRIYEKEFNFTQKFKKTLSREELCKELETKIKERLEKEEVKEYETVSKEFTDTENGLKLTVIISSEENIVYREELLVSKTD